MYVCVREREREREGEVEICSGDQELGKKKSEDRYRGRCTYVEEKKEKRKRMDEKKTKERKEK